MLATGLLILKIIGLLLLGILGLILAVVLLILLVPIRYRAEGSYYEEVKATASVSWLLHILSCKIIYDKELDIVIRIFGFPVGQREKKTVYKKAVRKKKKPKETVIEETTPKETVLEETVPEEITTRSESSVDDGKKTASTPKRKKREKPKRKNPFSFERICDKLREIEQKKEKILDMIKDEANQKTVRLLWRQLKAVLKHIFPRKLRGKVKFGFDDPYKTGQVLMYASPFYGLYKNRFQLIPVFEETILEGNVWLKGRIRIGTIIILGIRVLFDKNFRTLLKKQLN